MEKVAKALYATGIKEGDSIAAALESVPEFLELFLACEKIGCSIRNYLDPIADGIEFIIKSTASIFLRMIILHNLMLS